MSDSILDRIHIRDLHVRCIIGIYEDERREKQDVVLNITLFANLLKAGETDQIENTINYKSLKKTILKMVQASEFFLIETLAERTAAIALSEPAVQRVDVSVDKPGALRFARSVAVEITRTRTA